MTRSKAEQLWIKGPEAWIVNGLIFGLGAAAIGIKVADGINSWVKRREVLR